MKDPSSINPELIEEISVLKQRIKELEQSESDRKQAEEELRESEEKYRVLFEGMNDAVFVHDLDERGLPGRFLQVNDVACRRLGYTRDELLSLTPRDITMPEEYERIADKRTGLTSQGDILAETIHVTKDGREIPVESNIRQFQYLGRRVALSISRDITERKQAEEEIQRIKTAVDATGDAIGMSTADGHHFYQNEAFDHLFGYTQEEVSRLHPAKLYGNKDIVKKVFETIMAGKSWHGEIEMVAKNGRRFPVLLRADAVKDENGKVISLIGVHTDITDRKQAEIALRESRDKLAVIAEGSAIPQFAIDKDHTVILWNKALEIYSGVKAKDVLGTSDHWKAFYPEKRPCLVDLVLESSTEDEIARWYGNIYSRSNLIDGAYEATGYFPDMKEGTWLYFTAAAIKDPSENTIAGIETLEDITGLKTVEVSLRRAEQKYRSIFDNAVEGIFQSTPEGRYLSVNSAHSRMHGYSSPEELIQTVTDITTQFYVNPRDRQEFREQLERDGIIENFESQRYSKNGSIFWVSTNARTVRDEHGKVMYYEGTVEDITSRKQADEELEQTTEKLRKSLAGTIQVVSMTVETRDPYTAGHQRKVSNLARIIAQEMGLSMDTVDTIRMAGIIHDIGKISVPVEILSKPGKITDIEMSLIKVHSQSGYDILKDVGLPYPIAEIVLQHHERLDGSGYPQGLKDNEILLEAKIISVADVVEAIASHRPYRLGFGIDVALDEIEKNAGVLYDREAVEACLKLFREKEFKFE